MEKLKSGMDKGQTKNNFKRLLAVTGLVLVVFIGILSPIHKAHADCLFMPDTGTWDPPGCEDTASATTTGVAGVSYAPGAKEAAINGGSSSIVGGIFWKIVQMLASFVMRMCSLLLMLAGTLLNFVLDYTIVNMKANVDKLSGINVAWKVIRDLMNIAFIFLLVYEGIKMIIGLSDTTKVKKFITGVVLASILINFSLFFTKILIDASNVITIGIYNSLIDSTADPAHMPVGSDASATDIRGLSVPFMNALGLQGFFSSNITIGDNATLAMTFGLGSVLFIVVAFIFFAVACMFIVRYVVLIILLMLSPIAYMGMALSFMKQYADQWWAAFKSQLLFAPLYMLITWVVLTLMTSDGFITSMTGGNGDFSKLAAADNGPSLGLLLNFAVIIGLAIASLVIAKNTSLKGSQYISKMTSGVTAFAGGAIMGTAAAAGRRTVGAAASRLSESQRFQNWAGKSAVGERALKMTRGTAAGSFDLRASRVGQQTTGALGVNFGKAQEGGYNRTMADKTTQREKFAQSLRGNVAKEAYATRKASGLFTKGGSNSSALTAFGITGRSNRVVASKLLNDQLAPLESKETELQNRESQLTQQSANLESEVATLEAAIKANPVIAGQAPTPEQKKRQDRLDVINDSAYQPAAPGSPPGTKGAANRNSLAFIKERLDETQKNLANTSTEKDRIKKVIEDNGLVNKEGAPVPGVATPGQIRRLAQLNAQLAMINRVIAMGGGTPTPAQKTRLTNINTQMAGLQAAMNATIAATTIPGDPALGIKNPQTGKIRGRRADEQNF